MQFSKVVRYGVDFAINYGEPIQLFGGFTFGKNTNPVSGEKLDVRGFTVVGEWLVQDGFLLGAKWDYSRSDLQMNALKKVRPKATQHVSVYGLHQIAQNVQAFASFTHTTNLVTGMGMNKAAGTTTVFQQNTLNTFVAGVDLAL